MKPFNILRFSGAMNILRKSMPCLRQRDLASNIPTVAWLLENRAQRRGKPAMTKGKTSTASLYRMYEHFVVGNNDWLKYEAKLFFHHQEWDIGSIPDPEDPDPARYAIIGVLTKFLAREFNRVLVIGLPRGAPAIITPEMEEMLRAREIVLEHQPDWASKVVSLKKQLFIPDGLGNAPTESVRSSEFLTMNIIAGEPRMHVF